MRLRRFRKSESGLAATEFALLLPVMITLFFGMLESTMALLARADVSIMASTAADLISQESTTSSSDISNVYAAAGTILYPFYTGGSTGKPTIRLTSVIYDASQADPTKTGKVAWSCMQTGNTSMAALAKNSSYTFTQGLLTTGGSVIVADIAYTYSSPTTQIFAATFPMTNSFFIKPRRVAQIPAPDSCP